MKKNTQPIFALVIFCFFVSGMAGLIYQIAWARYLSLFLGHTSYAVVAVLVAFMGGLALGNAWFGIRADRSKKPLALYGWLEIGIGLYALAFPAYFSLCHDAFVQIARSWKPGSNGLLLLKFLFSFLTILVPTIMMGATFPVLTKFVTRALSELREKVAALYCINSVGAVAGCWVGGFWWIQALGLEGTLFAAAAMNLFVGVLSLLASASIQEGFASSAAPAPAPAAAEPEEQFTPAELKLAIVGIGVSGFVAMLYEVAWTRLLGLALGSSTHAFSLMLITFIAGIAVGAWIIYRWRTLRRTLDAFGWAELALAGTLLVSMFFYDRLPFWFAGLSGLMARRPEAYPIYQLCQMLICFIVMFIPAICLGMTLPLVSRIATAELARTGRSVGAVFAVNTLGTVLGAIITGLWLMPALGLARTLTFGIVLNALIGLSVVLRNKYSAAMIGPAMAVGACLVFLAGWAFNARWQQNFTQGLWRISNLSSRSSQSMKQRKILYYRDGAGSTVDLEETVSGGKIHLALRVNGKVDASTLGDITTQRLSSHIPLFLRPESQQVLVVGFGSGMTAGSAAQHPSVKRVDVVEISPEVIEAGQFFEPHNHEVLKNPRVKVWIEDAKSFLKITDQTYDVIVSEPSNPWMAGVAGVFSLEYYQSCMSRLRPDGLMAQWVQAYEINDDALEMVLRTFTSVFPYMSVWNPGKGDMLLIGSASPLKPDFAAMEERLKDPAVKADLADLGVDRLSVLLAREVISAENGLFIPTDGGPVHSDYFPALEFIAQRAFFLNQQANLWRIFDETLLTRPRGILGQRLAAEPLTDADFKAIGRFFLEYGLPQPYVFRTLLHRWTREAPDSTLPIEFSAQISDAPPPAELEMFRLAPKYELLSQTAERDPEPLRMYESHLMTTHRGQRSVFNVPPAEHLEAVLQRLLQTNPSNQRVYKLHLAEIAWDKGDDQRCFDLAQEAFDPDPAKGGPVAFNIDPAAPRWVLCYMIETLWRQGKIPEAWSLCQEAQSQGYLKPPRAYPWLEMLYRKVQSAAGQ